MLRLVFLVFTTVWSLYQAHQYDTYNGTKLSDKQFQAYVQAGVAPFCVISAEDCNATEGRRLDGTCNNLQHPTRGASKTPFARMLPPVYDNVDKPRKTKSGKEMPNGRFIRTYLLNEGRVPDPRFTNLVPTYWVFMTSDTVFPHDSRNYIYSNPSCCSAEGKNTSRCQQLLVPPDDPVHRFSGLRCLNYTTPISFQNTGCLRNGTAPERINTATAVFDLSIVYGSILNESLSGRLYEGGLLRYEMVNGNVWPPSVENPEICTENQGPDETRCHDVPDIVANSLFGINFFVIHFWRQHNSIAQELQRVNPSWDDDKLFFTARDINIAIAMQIYYHEFMPLMFGKDNMIRDKIITKSSGHRDIYDKNIIPQLSQEYLFSLRWVHLIQEGDMKLYDSNGHYVKNFPVVNMTFRTGYLALDRNLEYFTYSLIKQPMGKADDQIVDPDMAEVGLGGMIARSDIPALDNIKGRYLGLPPYIKYREHCSGKKYKTFDDLRDTITPERIQLLKYVYENVEDVELMAGLWLEKIMEGGSVPPTLYCLVADQVIRNMKTDRHFYERADRPNAFTEEQLKEIRKATVAGVLCNVGDNISRIQPSAFELPGPGNTIGSCEDIPKIDFNVFKEENCRWDYYKGIISFFLNIFSYRS